VYLGLRIGAYLRRIVGGCRRLLGLLGGWDGGSVPHYLRGRRCGLGGCERDDAPAVAALSRPRSRCPQVCGAPAAQDKPSGELPVRRRVRTEIGLGTQERKWGGKIGRSAVMPTGPGVAHAERSWGLGRLGVCVVRAVVFFVGEAARGARRLDGAVRFISADDDL
jgi:hypothetical protein